MKEISRIPNGELRIEEKKRLLASNMYIHRGLPLHPDGYVGLYHRHSLWILIFDASQDLHFQNKETEVTIPEGTRIGHMDFFPNKFSGFEPQNRTNATYKAVELGIAFLSYTQKLERSQKKEEIPHYLYGNTNTSMARFAIKRLGFWLDTSDDLEDYHTIVGETSSVTEKVETVKNHFAMDRQMLANLKQRAQQQREGKKDKK